MHVSYDQSQIHPNYLQILSITISIYRSIYLSIYFYSYYIYIYIYIVYIHEIYNNMYPLSNLLIRFFLFYIAIFIGQSTFIQFIALSLHLLSRTLN